MILQNFVPHPRYYGAEVADIADQAATRQWGGRPTPSPEYGLWMRVEGLRRARYAHSGSGIDRSGHAGVGDPGELDDMKRLIAECRRLMPDVGVQVPPNLAGLVA